MRKLQQLELNVKLVTQQLSHSREFKALFDYVPDKEKIYKPIGFKPLDLTAKAIKNLVRTLQELDACH